MLASSRRSARIDRVPNCSGLFPIRALPALLALAIGLSGCAVSERHAASERAFAESLALLERERYAAALSMLDTLAAHRPDDAAVHVNRALALQALERDQDARQALQAALQADPNHAEAHNLMAIQLRRAGRFDAARRHYEQLLEAHPEHAHGHLNLAILCDIYLADLECAHHYYRRYLALSNEQDEEVTNWLTDLERRLPGEDS